jgi:hypothetical protein
MPPENRKFDFLSLPEDVLIPIFLCCQEDEDSDRYTKLDPLSIRLSQTSSQLRQAVLSIPQIWATLDRRVWRSSHLLDLFLERSQTHGLTIILDDSSFDDDEKVINQLVSHIHRWHSLEIKSDWRETFLEIIVLLQDLSAPNLRHLKISLTEDEYPDDAILATIFSGGVPSLRSLEMYSVACFPPSLDALTTLQLYVAPSASWLLPYARFCTQLQSMPSLVHLILIGEVTEWPPTEAVEKVNLPSLRSLLIDLGDEDLWKPEVLISSPCALFPTTTIEYLSLGYLTEDILGTFLDFLNDGTIRFPHVKYLWWCTHLIKEEEIVTFVKAFPMLEECTLSIESDDIIKVILKYDSDSSAKEVFWPHLRTLSMFDVRIGVLRDFIAARLSTNRPIEKVQVDAQLKGKWKESKEIVWLYKHAKLEFIPDDSWSVWVAAVEGTWCTCTSSLGEVKLIFFTCSPKMSRSNQRFDVGEVKD